MSDPVRFEVRGQLAVVTIERPHARNAVDGAVALALEAAVDRLEDDPALRAGVLTGAPPDFCAGADLKVAARGEGDTLYTARGGFGGIVKRRRTKPLIAAVEGHAYGGGTELVLACDLVVAGAGADFALPEVKRGVFAAGGGTVRLARRVPLGVAMACALTGDPLGAEDAHRHGLVQQLVPDGEALAAALVLAGRIAANAPVAVRESRRTVLEAVALDDADAFALAEEANERVLASPDADEGVRAFVEKRPPRWA